MNEVLTRLAPTAEEALPDLCRRFGVSRLDLFGSAADGRFDPERSDLDFLATFDSEAGGSRFDRYFDFKEALERCSAATSTLSRIVPQTSATRIFGDKWRRSR